MTREERLEMMNQKQQREAKKEQVLKTLAKSNPFYEKLDSAKSQEDAMYKQKRELGVQLRELESAMNKQSAYKSYLQNIVQRARYRKENNIPITEMAWNVETEENNNPPYSRHITCTVEIMARFHTLQYDFGVVVKDDTTKKRDKWAVSLWAHTQVNGYNDNDYGKRIYDWESSVPSFKFKTREEAEAFAEDWKTKFVADHKEAIEAEAKLLEEAAKGLKKLEAVM